MAKEHKPTIFGFGSGPCGSHSLVKDVSDIVGRKSLAAELAEQEIIDAIGALADWPVASKSPSDRAATDPGESNVQGMSASRLRLVR